MQKVDKRAVISAILVLVMTGFVFIFVYVILNTNNAPEDSSALFGGQSESRFPYVGYTMTTVGSENYLCGINYVSSTHAITAAHCIENYSALYPNIGTFSSNYTSTSFGGTGFIHPNYAGVTTTANAGVKDIAVIKLNNNANLNEYATIATPTVSCNYYITGYGINEGGLNYQRRGGSVCIDLITPERVELTRNAGFAFFCNGDSGAGIYESGTNKLVAVISAFAPAGSCTNATRFYATRVDVNMPFINQYITTSTVTPTQVQASCPANLNTQFWTRCPGPESAGCGGLDGWIGGNRVENQNLSVPFNLDINCFANGGAFENSRVELYRNGNLITSNNDLSLSDYQITQPGTYEAVCKHKTINNCENRDEFTIGTAVTTTPTATQTTTPIVTQSPTTIPSISPTTTITQTQTPVATTTLSPTSIITNSPTQVFISPTQGLGIVPTNIVTPTNTVLPQTAITSNKILIIALGLMMVTVGVIIRVQSEGKGD